MTYLTQFLIIFFLYSGLYSSALSVQIDTSRFKLSFSNNTAWLVDELQRDSIIIDDLLIEAATEFEEKEYVSSANYSSKTNAFDLGNGLLAIHLVSYDFTKQGSAQAGAGWDLFLIYDPVKHVILDTVLEFGITKQRQRYMGCLFAKTSHFILADVDNNGIIDIGRIKEELKCNDAYQTYFVQDPVEWYGFTAKQWNVLPKKMLADHFVDLPLIDIKMNPVDVFGFNKWRSHDPKDWAGMLKVPYYPQYRLKLIKAINR